MDVTVTKKIEQGIVTLLIDGKNPSDEIMSGITGTTIDGSRRIFSMATEPVRFYYGSFCRSFTAMPETTYSLTDDPVAKIADCIRQRLQSVRDWVRSIPDSSESVTVTIDDGDSCPDDGTITSRPVAERIRSILALGNRAKNNGQSYDQANACWALAMALNIPPEGLYSAQLIYESGNDDRNGTYYHLATLSAGGESLCIPVPLLSRDWAIHFAKGAKWVLRGDHNRVADEFSENVEGEILNELRRLVTASEAEEAKTVLENVNDTLEILARKRRVIHKKIVRVDDDDD